MTYPTFNNGDTLPASDLNAIGLWLVKTQTIGTGVSSVVVTGAFSADYDNYLITVSGGVGSANLGLDIQFGATVSGYKSSFLFTFYSATVGAIGTSSGTAIAYVGGGTTSSLSGYITVQNPFLAEETFVQATSTTGVYSGNATGQLPNTTSYTGFTLVSAGGTITGGTIRVYGYRN